MVKYDVFSDVGCTTNTRKLKKTVLCEDWYDFFQCGAIGQCAIDRCNGGKAANGLQQYGGFYIDGVQVWAQIQPQFEPEDEKCDVEIKEDNWSEVANLGCFGKHKIYEKWIDLKSHWNDETAILNNLGSRININDLESERDNPNQGPFVPYIESVPTGHEVRVKVEKAACGACACAAGQSCGNDPCGGSTCGDCPSYKECSGGTCVCKANACGDGCDCDTPKQCSNGACFCPLGSCGGVCGTCGAGQTCVNYTCEDDNTSCSPACTANQECNNGTCVCKAGTCGSSCLTCTAPKTCVDGNCVCPSGTCGDNCVTCTANQTCVNGTCVCKAGTCGSSCLTCGTGKTCKNGVCEDDEETKILGMPVTTYFVIVGLVSLLLGGGIGVGVGTSLGTRWGVGVGFGVFAVVILIGVIVGAINI